MTRAYYNQIDPFAAAWLRNLMEAKLIPEGDVDERSICDVPPDDLKGYQQCHFFAGIGGWAYAMRLAGYDDLECWTGSCPCQPLSSAGKQKGHADERHLWPAFFSLIQERRPSMVFGEQVSGTLGFEWFAGVRADLEDVGYACGASDLCAAGVGAPHIRQRLFWCAMANPDSRATRLCGNSRSKKGAWSAYRHDTDGCGNMDDSDDVHGNQEQSISERPKSKPNGRSPSFWSDAVWQLGSDGKARRAKPGIPLLAYGIPNRMGRFRGFGNAIVPQVGAAFIQAVMECRP